MDRHQRDLCTDCLLPLWAHEQWHCPTPDPDTVELFAGLGLTERTS